MKPKQMFLDHIDTPIGEFAIIVDDDRKLCAAGFTKRHERMEREIRVRSNRGESSLVRASDPGGWSAAIERYFAGDLAAFDGPPIAMRGTPFQLAVWRALREIPSGETRSYADVARRIGNPKAVRAVGLANGNNPIGVIVPCHRVIGSNGSLTGYGGGIDRKRWLLAHERARLGQTSSAA